jgi:hypothetical protein
MICVLTTPIDLANYIDVWNLKKRRPEQRVCHISWADLSGIGLAETLYLLGHGDTHEVEGKSADDLAELLVAKGLTHPLRKVKLLVCCSGSPVLGGQPYCQLLADALVEAGGPRTIVIGFEGDATATDDQAKSFGLRIYPEYGEFMKKNKSAVKKLSKRAESLPYATEEQILKAARELAGDSEEIFKWLYANNKLHAVANTKTFGIPGQVI